VSAAAGGGQENPSARGQKISSPETPPFFARSFLEFTITKNSSFEIDRIKNLFYDKISISNRK